MLARTAAWLVVLLALCGARVGAAEAPVDGYGGIRSVAGRRTGAFRIDKLGKRWWLVTPEGHGLFVRAVSKVDTSDYGGSGGFLSYDAVYVQSAGGPLSANLAAAAEDSRPGDVVGAGGATVRGKGDALYLGSSRFRPNYSYFWLQRKGEGGRMEWYYSTAGGWKPIGTGQPWKAAALNGAAWSLDAGNYIAPDASGFGESGSANANRVAWWDMAAGFPADFAMVTLPGDPAPRYYVKGVVAEPYTVPPILSQLYERADLGEGIARKYGPGDWAAKWSAAMAARLRSWGYNAAGMYSYQYADRTRGLAGALPSEPTWQLSGWALDKRRPYHAKSVYAGAVFPPGSASAIYQGVQADVFDPAFRTAYRALARSQRLPAGGRYWALIPEEADLLFGLDSRTHDHLGYVALSQNPYRNRDAAAGIDYTDPRFYAKYALRDFLRSRYAAQAEKLGRLAPASATPAYPYTEQPVGAEKAALNRLNGAWGTHYTTWGTSSGDLLAGTNAYGKGSGFLDEDGRSVVAEGARSPGFDKAFTNPAHPAIRKDLDDFVGFFAARYGAVLAEALQGVEHPPLLLPIYDAPDAVYRALAPYVDGFWVSVTDARDAVRIYNAGHKPLLLADYLTADPDSQLFFGGSVSAIRYDPAAGGTIVTASGLRYWYRMAQLVGFPGATELNKTGMCGGKYVYPFPRLKAARWDTVELPGDFTACIRPGMRFEKWRDGGYPLRTQADRARAMAARYESMLNLVGDDGCRFVLGFEHWCLYDPSVSNWGDNEDFGIVTLQDNAYDGVEARRAPGKDARGYARGGEEDDYGDLLGPLGAYLRGLDARLAAGRR